MIMVHLMVASITTMGKKSMHNLGDVKQMA